MVWSILHLFHVRPKISPLQPNISSANLSSVLVINKHLSHHREPESWNVSTGTSRSPGPEHAWYKLLNGSRNSETWMPFRHAVGSHPAWCELPDGLRRISRSVPDSFILCLSCSSLLPLSNIVLCEWLTSSNWGIPGMGKHTVVSSALGPKLAVLFGSRRQGSASRARTAKGRHDCVWSERCYTFSSLPASEGKENTFVRIFKSKEKSQHTLMCSVQCWTCVTFVFDMNQIRDKGAATLANSGSQRLYICVHMWVVVCDCLSARGRGKHKIVPPSASTSGLLQQLPPKVYMWANRAIFFFNLRVLIKE